MLTKIAVLKYYTKMDIHILRAVLNLFPEWTVTKLDC